MIEVIDNAIPRRLCQEAYYYLDMYSGWQRLADSPDTGSNYTLGCTFTMDELEPIAAKVYEAIGKPRAKKCLYNCFRHGDSPSPHVDSFSPKGITYLLYVNLEWSVDMGGETIFINSETDDIVKSVLPRAGRLIKFDSTIPHMARPPVRDGYPRRYSIVFQSHPTDDISISDIL
jgi:Rps23 Pro-64 3,4-dihydroxylase Tpa1-like proline 4-hydroxylase|tara:strand:+ start:183 stop:704 length:522 start_codon:yes stop_codon:yes gene_type:complete